MLQPIEYVLVEPTQESSQLHHNMVNMFVGIMNIGVRKSPDTAYDFEVNQTGGQGLRPGSGRGRRRETAELGKIQ
jgi:hypothetical protein